MADAVTDMETENKKYRETNSRKKLKNKKYRCSNSKDRKTDFRNRERYLRDSQR